jgi:hypothetical protein
MTGTYSAWLPQFVEVLEGSAMATLVGAHIRYSVGESPASGALSRVEAATSLETSGGRTDLLDCAWVNGLNTENGRVERTARSPSFATRSSRADGHPRRPPPHRSGRADFPHPAPLVRASLCAGWSAPLGLVAVGTGRGSPCRRCSRSGSAGSAFAGASTRSASRSAEASRSSRSSR